MKRLPRCYFGNPVLRIKAKPVSKHKFGTSDLQELIREMFFTMRRVGGVGLAAPQIGKSIQLAVVEINKTLLRPGVVSLEPTVIVNPAIVSHSRKRVTDWEGCLSFPNARGLVPRYQHILVSYFDQFGEKKRLRLEGFQARVFQHEIDHLNGTLYVDRMPDMKSLMTLDEFKKRVVKRTGLKSR
jgi:peptide deformylase